MTIVLPRRTLYRWQPSPLVKPDAPFLIRPELCVNLASDYAAPDLVKNVPATVNSSANVSRVVGPPGTGLGNAFVGNTLGALTYTGRPTAAQTKVTMAALFRWDSNLGANFPQLMGTSSANSGFRLGSSINIGGDLGLVKGGVASLSVISLTSGVPYFVVASHDQASGDYYITARRFDTNARVSNTQTHTTASTGGNGTFCVGNARLDFNGAWNGHVYFAYIAFDYLPRAAAEEWLDNPWRVFSFNRTTLLPAAGGGTTVVTISATCAGTVSVSKLISKAANVSCLGTVSAAKNVGKSVAPTVSSTVSITALKSVLIAISAACSTTVSAAKQVAKSVSTTAATTVSLLKSIAKKIAATSTTTAAVTALKSVLITISAALATTVTLKKAVGKTIAATAATTVSAIKQVAKSVASTSATAVTALKTVAKNIAATATTAVTVTRSLARSVTISVTVSTLSSIRKAMTKTVSVTGTGTVSVIKQIAKKVSVNSLLTVIALAIRAATSAVARTGGAVTGGGGSDGGADSRSGGNAATPR